MASRREKFPDQSEELPLGIDQEETATEPRFNPSQRRAFGSVPNLLGSSIDLTSPEQIPARAWELTEPVAMRAGLHHENAKYLVNGLALSPEYYETIVRNQKAFLGSTGAKTIRANRLAHPERQQEKYDKSQVEPLVSKHARHEPIIADLQAQQDNLSTLLQWQRARGYSRTDESDMRIRATQAWQQTFMGMLQTLKDNHELSEDDQHAMEQALASRLFRGEQSRRMAAWGSYLELGAEYTRGVKLLFMQSDQKIGRALVSRAIEAKE